MLMRGSTMCVSPETSLNSRRSPPWLNSRGLSVPTIHASILLPVLPRGGNFHALVCLASRAPGVKSTTPIVPLFLAISMVGVSMSCVLKLLPVLASLDGLEPSAQTLSMRVRLLHASRAVRVSTMLARSHACVLQLVAGPFVKSAGLVLLPPVYMACVWKLANPRLARVMLVGRDLCVRVTSMRVLLRLATQASSVSICHHLHCHTNVVFALLA